VISALFVASGGVYSNIPDIDPWDIERDARKYHGPNKVIAHPPCTRWGSYFHGMKKKTDPSRPLLGDDSQTFAAALWAVRTFSGIIEHPAKSRAWDFYGMSKPSPKGGWTLVDEWGGASCQIHQGKYGHRSDKATWLYAVGIKFAELDWGKSDISERMEHQMKSESNRESYRKYEALGVKLSGRSREPWASVAHMCSATRRETPIEFRDLLMHMVNGVQVENNIKQCSLFSGVRND